ncbi:MAG: tyrosine-type recombinase/integrase [Lysobacteraceae bacterium]
MKLSKKLSPAAVEAAKPEADPYRVWDTVVPQLHLRVQPSGVKSWNVQWSRTRSRSLGKWPGVTVEAARTKAKQVLVESDEHGAPLAVIEAGKPAEARPITLGDFVGEHFAPWALANQKQGRATVDALRSVFGKLYDRELRAVSAFDVERVKAARLRAGRKPATVNRDLDRIRKVFSCAMEWGFVSDHPLRPVKRAKGADNSRVRYLSKSEEKRLRDALEEREQERRRQRLSGNEWCAARGQEPRPVWAQGAFTDHLMPLVLLALNTGLRRGELFGLEWGDVNLSSKLLTVTAGNAKSRKARHVPLNREALDVLKRWHKQGEGRGLVFPGIGGGRMTNVNKSWDALVAAAGLEDFRFHDLRHDFASKLVMAGVDLNTVRELLGHADIAMTLRYAHLAPHKLADAVALLGGSR